MSDFSVFVSRCKILLFLISSPSLSFPLLSCPFLSASLWPFTIPYKLFIFLLLFVLCFFPVLRSAAPQEIWEERALVRAAPI